MRRIAAQFAIVRDHADYHSPRQGLTMTVTLTLTLSPELSALVKSKVASGRYSDSEAVLREALELLEEQEQLERLRAALAIGEEQFERGEYVEYTPTFMEGAKRRARENMEKGHKVSPDVLP
jgi:putative addiction module CopG family antidote